MWSDYISAQVVPILEDFRAQGVFNFGVLGFLTPAGERLLWKVGSGFATDAVFDLASLTKCAPTATLALQHLVAGDLHLSDSVQKWLPELRMSAASEITVWHLLTHTLDYRLPMSTLKDLPSAQILDKLYGYEFNLAPGAAFNYGNPASVLLGILLERLNQTSLAELGAQRVFAPLGMAHTTFLPLEHGIPAERIVPTERCTWRGRALRGEVHDESAFALGQPVGSAGVFGTAGDLLRLLQHYLSEPALLALASGNQLSHLGGQGTALGWELSNPRFMGNNVGPQSFGKTGFTGMSMIADPERRVGVVWLCDFTWPQREKSVERIFALRRSVHEKIWSA